MLQSAGIKVDYKLLLAEIICNMELKIAYLAIASCVQELNHY